MALNMDQKRASFALGQVAWLKEKEEANNISTQSAKFIALILNSGFLQAMDFAGTKLNGAIVILNKWFAEDDKETGPKFSESIKKAAANGSLNQKLAELDDINEYRRVMEEAVVFFGWLKSKAEGKKMELENKQGDHVGDKET
ncbi:MAG: type III-B CRISPR module-associated protein Cmr5 [Deltaproteobacteria bacterium]|nr:type III-B CRISPR module-associated protein Cmr5 [Deltaproteobacteria bacterium]